MGHEQTGRDIIAVLFQVDSIAFLGLQVLGR
jgi:hypothetical protein